MLRVILFCWVLVAVASLAAVVTEAIAPDPFSTFAAVMAFLVVIGPIGIWGAMRLNL